MIISIINRVQTNIKLKLRCPVVEHTKL